MRILADESLLVKDLKCTMKGFIEHVQERRLVKTGRYNRECNALINNVQAGKRPSWKTAHFVANTITSN